MARSIPPNLNAYTLFLKNKTRKTKERKTKKIETKINHNKTEINQNKMNNGFLVHAVSSVPLIWADVLELLDCSSAFGSSF
jgi:ATP-dependent 26S proteasome regulatory subunit